MSYDLGTTDPYPHYYYSEVKYVYTNEFTDQMLKTGANRLLRGAGYPGNWTTTPASARLNIQTNGYSADGNKFKFRLAFNGEPGVSYNFNWEEKTTSPTGGASTSSKSVTIQGTGGLQYSPEYEVYPSEAGGTVEVGKISISVPPNQSISKNIPLSRWKSGMTDSHLGAMGESAFGSAELGGFESEAEESCATCGMGSRVFIPRGLTFLVGLGLNENGARDGALAFNETMVLPDTVDPERLVLQSSSDNTVVISRSNYVHQVRTDEGLLQVEKLSSSSFSIKSFSPAGITAVTNGQGEVLHYTNATSPIKTLIIRDITADGATNRTVNLEWITASATNEFYYDFFETNELGTSFERFRSTKYRKEILSQPTATNGVTETIKRVYTPAGADIIYQARILTKQFTWGSADILQETGTGTNALTTYYYYQADTNAAGFGFANPVYKPLLQVAYPDGYWEKYEYYDDGKLKKVTKPFKNSSPADAVNDVIEYSYDTLTAYNDTTNRPYSPRIETHKIGSTVVKLAYYIYGDYHARVLEWNKPNPSAQDTNYLETRQDFYASGANLNRLWKTTYPDGTIELRDYTSGGGYTTNTLRLGKADGNGQSVTDGRRLVRTLNAQGRVVREQLEDIPSEAVLDWADYAYDATGMPSQATYPDGTTETWDFTCCGLNTHTDREGVLRVYLYDSANRPWSYEEYHGQHRMVFFNTLDAAGHVLARGRYADADGTSLSLGRDAYRDNGLMSVSTNIAGVVTRWSQIFTNGYFCQYATLNEGQAGSGTSWRYYYKDRQLAEVGGTAEHPLKYDFNVESGATNHLVRAEMKVGSDGNTNQWEKIYTDMLGRVDRRLFADNHSRTYAYNALGQLEQEVDEDGVVKYRRYNDRGEWEITATSVDGAGALDYANDYLLKTLRFATNHAGTNKLVSQTWVWNTVGSTASNLLRQTETATNGLRVWDTYKLNGNDVIARTQVSYNTNTQYKYVTNWGPDNAYAVRGYQYGWLRSESRQGSNGSVLEARSYEYDAHGRVSRVVDLRNGAMVYGYNALDQLVSVTTPAPGIGQAAQTVGLAYDGWGRRWVTTLADGTRTTNEYYATGELKQQAGSRTYPAGYGYDSQGRLRFMTNWTAFSSAGARVTEWQYEALRGWLTKKIHPGETDTTADYEYTYAGRLWKRHGERGVDTIYTHNAAGDLQVIDYSDSTPDVTLGYDRRGRLRTVARNGMTTTLAYNEVNELTSESHSGGTLNGLAVTRGYDALGRRTSLSLNTQAPGINYSYGYNSANGRLETVTSGNYMATYSYLANSPLVSQIVFQDNGATRMTTARQYDKLNRLQSISSTPSGAGQMPLGFRQGYDAANQRNRVNLPDGSYWVYEYDALGQVKAGKKHFADNTLVPGQQFEYTHDDIGNRTATKAGGDQYGQNLRSAAYTADALNLYTSRGVPNAVDVVGIAINTNAVTVNGAAAQYRKGEYFRHELTVNNANNPVWQSVTVSSGGSNAVGNVFVPKTPEGFSYDSDGTLMADGRWYYTWDGENRLVQVEYLGSAPAGSKRRLVLEYDGMGRRIRKTVTNVDTSAVILDNKFMYDGWNLMAELNATNNNVIRSYTWGLDLSGSLQGAGGVGGLLMVNDAAQGLHFAANDSNGNVAGLVNAANGSITAVYEYGAFGELIRATGPMGRVNPIRFSSKYYDEETDLVAYPYRYYSPSLGRWLSKDPMAEKGGLNLCAYVGNNSINQVDPFGLWNLWNPATWGDPNAIDWSWINSFIPWHESSGYNWERIKQITSEADAAFLDGLNPFGNPFAKMGFYDPCNKSMKWARGTGILTGVLESAFSLGAAAFTAPGTSIFYSGYGARVVATGLAEAGEGSTIFNTVGGSLLNAFGVQNIQAWRIASWFFANTTGREAIVVLGQGGGVAGTVLGDVEAGVLAARGVSVLTW